MRYDRSARKKRKDRSFSGRDNKVLSQRVVDFAPMKSIYHAVCHQMITHDMDTPLDYHNIMQFIKDNEYTEMFSNIEESPLNLTDARQNLKNLQSILSQQAHHGKSINKIKRNEIDPDFDYRFLNRKTLKDIPFPVIKTRLKWQNGEYPFFRADVRYDRQLNQVFKEQRRLSRFAKSYIHYDANLGTYQKLDMPQDRWPVKGKLYVTNYRMLFKKGKDTHVIPMSIIEKYRFYENAIVIEFIQYDKHKIIDVFYIDPEEIRILEAVLRITI